MSDDPNSTQTPPELPQAAVGGKRRFSLVWLIPIVAAIAGAWLVYTTFAERGPTITITFQFASGLEPGKTPIKYRDVQLGLVETVTLSDDLQHVLVTARMEKAAENELRDGTRTNGPTQTAAGNDLRHLVVFPCRRIPGERVLPHSLGWNGGRRSLVHVSMS